MYGIITTIKKTLLIIPFNGVKQLVFELILLKRKLNYNKNIYIFTYLNIVDMMAQTLIAVT